MEKNKIFLANERFDSDTIYNFFLLEKNDNDIYFLDNIDKLTSVSEILESFTSSNLPYSNTCFELVYSSYINSGFKSNNLFTTKFGEKNLNMLTFADELEREREGEYVAPRCSEICSPHFHCRKQFGCTVHKLIETLLLNIEFERLYDEKITKKKVSPGFDRYLCQ